VHIFDLLSRVVLSRDETQVAEIILTLVISGASLSKVNFLSFYLAVGVQLCYNQCHATVLGLTYV